MASELLYDAYLRLKHLRKAITNFYVLLKNGIKIAVGCLFKAVETFLENCLLLLCTSQKLHQNCCRTLI